MTRKRFVKLLMSAGYDRNEANAHAADARRCWMQYSAACAVYSKMAEIDITAFCDSVRSIVITAARVAAALSNAAVAFAKAYQETMEASHE